MYVSMLEYDTAWFHFVTVAFSVGNDVNYFNFESGGFKSRELDFDYPVHSQ